MLENIIIELREPWWQITLTILGPAIPASLLVIFAYQDIRERRRNRKNDRTTRHIDDMLAWQKYLQGTININILNRVIANLLMNSGIYDERNKKLVYSLNSLKNYPLSIKSGNGIMNPLLHQACEKMRIDIYIFNELVNDLFKTLDPMLPKMADTLPPADLSHADIERQNFQVKELARSTYASLCKFQSLCIECLALINLNFTKEGRFLKRHKKLLNSSKAPIREIDKYIRVIVHYKIKPDRLQREAEKLHREFERHFEEQKSKGIYVSR